MKPITLHPVSVLAGLALAGILAAASQSVTRVQPFPKETVRLVGEVPAEWWTFVEISTAANGTPITTYTVPAGHFLVVTDYWGEPLFADGQNVSLRMQPLGPYATTGSGTRVPFQAGTVLSAGYTSVWGDTGTKLWGYLEPVNP